MKSLTVLSAVLCLSIANGANILGIFTSLSPSHNIVHLSVVKAFIEKGHNVTVISRLPMNDDNLDFHHILIPLTSEQKAQYNENMKTSNKSSLQLVAKSFSVIPTMVNLQYDTFLFPEVQSFLNSGIKIDAVILGYFFNDFHLAVAAQLKAPVIISWVVGPFFVANSLAGNPTGLSYVPNLMVTTDVRMSFFTRVVNVLVSGLFSILESFANYKFVQYYE